MEWRNVTLQVQLLRYCELVQLKYIYEKSGVAQGGSHMTPLLIISVYAVFKLTKWPINARSIILPGHVYHWLSSLPNLSLFYLMHMHFYDASVREIHCEGDTVSTVLSTSFYFQDMIFFLLSMYNSTYLCITSVLIVLIRQRDCIFNGIKDLFATGPVIPHMHPPLWCAKTNIWYFIFDLERSRNSDIV